MADAVPPLTQEQAALLLGVLRVNHAHYVAQGMDRAHMWPAELLDEVRRAFEQGQPIEWTQPGPMTDHDNRALSSFRPAPGRSAAQP